MELDHDDDVGEDGGADGEQGGPPQTEQTEVTEPLQVAVDSLPEQAELRAEPRLTTLGGQQQVPGVADCGQSTLGHLAGKHHRHSGTHHVLRDHQRVLRQLAAGEGGEQQQPHGDVGEDAVQHAGDQLMGHAAHQSSEQVGQLVLKCQQLVEDVRVDLDVAVDSCLQFRVNVPGTTVQLQTSEYKLDRDEMKTRSIHEIRATNQHYTEWQDVYKGVTVIIPNSNREIHHGDEYEERQSDSDGQQPGHLPVESLGRASVAGQDSQPAQTALHSEQQCSVAAPARQKAGHLRHPHHQVHQPEEPGRRGHLHKVQLHHRHGGEDLDREVEAAAAAGCDQAEHTAGVEQVGPAPAAGQRTHSQQPQEGARRR